MTAGHTDTQTDHTTATKVASHVVPLLSTELYLLLRTPQQKLPMLFTGSNDLQNCPFPWTDLDPPPIQRTVPWAHASRPPNGISIGSSVFAGFIRVPNRQTDRHTAHAACDICSNTPHQCIACRQCDLKQTYGEALAARCGQLVETLGTVEARSRLTHGLPRLAVASDPPFQTLAPIIVHQLDAVAGTRPETRPGQTLVHVRLAPRSDEPGRAEAVVATDAIDARTAVDAG